VVGFKLKGVMACSHLSLRSTAVDMGELIDFCSEETAPLGKKIRALLWILDGYLCFAMLSLAS
jgi:hypothetical protein